MLVVEDSPRPRWNSGSNEDRAIWFDGYVWTYLERNPQVLSAIFALPDFRRMMRASCLRMGQVVNQTALGRDVALPQPTVHRYLNLLETSYLLVPLPAYAVNRTKRLIKAPKLYWGDMGVAMHLAQESAPRWNAPEEPGAARPDGLARFKNRTGRTVLLAHLDR